MALSGGVDSAVAAAVALRDGHEVVGITMKLWGGPSDSGCCSVSDVDDARRVASQLGIAHYVFNFAEEFDRHVVTPYVDAHRRGETPNPCVECNRFLKFDVLLRRSELLGFDVVATGHHARIEHSDGHPWISRGADQAKDQSYVLYPLHGEDLHRVWFPIGGMQKSEVRALAADLGLRTATKPDSQDVCFISREDGRDAFLRERLHPTTAEIVDSHGVRLGVTDAAEFLTVGQRRGVAIGGGTDRRYVLEVSPAARRVVIGTRDELLVEHTDVVNVVWAWSAREGVVAVQTSAHGAATMARAEVRPWGIRLYWDEPKVRVAPGQSVVLYVDNRVCAGGFAANPRE